MITANSDWTASPRNYPRVSRPTELHQQHFKAAAELVGHDESKLRAEYLNRYANALRDYGDYRGDNAVLTQSIAVYRAALAEIRREELSLTWAMTQNNLGIALQALGERRAARHGWRK